MKKNILRKLLSSIFSSDDDDTQLVQGKEEMANKVDKILELINAQEKGDRSQDGPELVSLVENFYTDYRELYRRYDDLVEKLKKSVHKGNGMNGDASGSDSSSESDSSDLDVNKEGKKKICKMEFEEMKVSFHQYEVLQKELDGLKIKNKDLEMETTLMLVKLNEAEKISSELFEKKTAFKELENELCSMKESRKVLEDDNERLKFELEISIQQKVVMNEKLKSIHEQNEALFSEKSSALQKSCEAEKFMEVLKIECDKLKDEITRLQDDDAGLKEDLGRAMKQVADLSKKLEISNGEKERLSSENSTLLIKMNEAEESIRYLKIEADKLTEDLYKLQNEDAGLKLHLVSLKEEVADLNKQLQDSSKEKDAVCLENSIALKKLFESENSVKVLKIEVSNLKENISKLQNEGKTLEQELESTSKRASDLSKKLGISNEEKNALSLDNSTVLSKIKKAEKEIEDLKNEAGANLEVSNRRSSENAQLLVEIGSLNHKLEEAEKMRDDLSKGLLVAKEESSNLSLEISKFQKQILESGKAIEDLKHELTSNVKLINEKSSENATLLTEITRLKFKLQADGKEKSDLHKKLNVAKEESSYLNSEISRIQKQIDNAEKVVENLKHEASTNLELADKRSSENSQLLVEIVSLNHKLEGADKEKSELKKEITVAEEKSSDLNSEISRLSKQIEDEGQFIENLKNESGANLELANKRSSENAQLHLEIESLMINLKTSDKERSDLNKELANAKEESRELRTKISQISIQIDEADKTIEKLKAECGELKDIEFKLLHENKHLNHELRVKHDEIHHLSMKNTGLLDEIRLARELGDGLSGKVELLNKEKSHLLNDHETLKIEVKESHGKVIELERMLEQAQTERDALFVNNEILISEKSSLSTRLDDTEKSTDELKNETIELQSKNSSLKQEFEKTVLQVSDLTLQLTTLHEEKSVLNLEKVLSSSRIEQAQKDIESFKNEASKNLVLADKRSAEIAELLQEINHLSSKMVEVEQLKAALVQDLAIANEESGSLKSEISSTRIQMQEIEKFIEELRSDYDLSKEENSKLVAINMELNEKLKIKDGEIVAFSLKHTETISNIRRIEESAGEQLKRLNEEKTQLLVNYECLKSEKESADLKIAKVVRMLDGIQEEKQVLSSENAQRLIKIEQLDKMTNDLQSEIEHGKCDNLELQKRLEVKADEVIVLGKKLEEVQIEASNNINTITTHVNNLQRELDMMHSQNSDLKEEVVAVTKDLSESKMIKEKVESELTEKMSEQASRLDENQKKINDLMIDYKKLCSENAQLLNKIEQLDKMTNDLQCEIEHGKCDYLELEKKLEVKAGEVIVLGKKFEDVQIEASNNINTITTHVNNLQGELDMMHSQNNDLKGQVLAVTKDLSESKMIKEKVESELTEKMSEQASRLDENQKKFNDLMTDYKILCSENAQRLNKIEQLHKMTNDLQCEIEHGKCDNLELEKRLEVKADEVIVLGKKLEEVQIEASNNINTITTHVNNLQRELDMMRSQNSDLKEQVVAVTKDLSESKMIKEKVESELTEKMSEQASRLDENQKTFNDLMTDYKLLCSENAQILNKIEKLDKMTNDLQCEIEHGKCDNLKLEKKLEVKADEVIVLEKKLEEVQIEASNNINTITTHVNNLQGELDMMHSQNNDLKGQVLAVTKDLSESKMIKEKVESELTEKMSVQASRLDENQKKFNDLMTDYKILCSENAQRLNKIEQLHKMANDLQCEIEHGKCDNLELEKRLEVKADEVIVLGKKLEEVQIEASNNINTITTHVNNLQRELDMMRSQNSDLKEQVVAVTKDLSESKMIKEKVENELTEKMSEQASRLDENQKRFNDLMIDYQIIEDQFRQSCVKLDTVENMIVELEAIIVRKEKEKTNADKEKKKVKEQVESLEVQLCLVNQKLKVTETEHRAKEEDNESRMNELLEDKSGLQEQIEVLYRKASHLEIQTKKVLAIELDRLSDTVHKIEIMFDKNCADFQVKLVKFFEELRTMKETTKALVSKIQELESEKLNLIDKVEQNNGSFFKLKEEAAILQMKLIEKTKEEERLRDMTVQYQSKLLELQKSLEQKEEEGRFKDEEKREVIRQLCYQIEYHREKCDSMFQIISAKVKKN